MLEFEIFVIHDILKFDIVVIIIAILSLIFDISPSPNAQYCIAHAKMKFLSLFTHGHVILMLYNFLY